MLEEDDDKKESNVMAVLMKYRIVIMLLGIMVIVLTMVWVINNGIAEVKEQNLPSEEKCQILGMQANAIGVKDVRTQWCEFDGMAWHFNETAYIEHGGILPKDTSELAP